MPRETFRENVVVITGASSGIGRALSVQLAARGAHLVLAARRERRLEELAEACRADGAKAIGVPVDVADEAACGELISTAVREFGRVDTLITNAGVGARGNVGELPDLSQFRRLMETNFFGTLHCIWHALPHLERTGGRIVAISSIIGRLAVPGEAAYCASKFAVTGLCDALRMELKGTGISVTVVYPGYVVSEFAEKSLQQNGEPHGPDARQLYTNGMMSAEACASKIIGAAARRQRDLYTRLRERVATGVNLVTPRLSDLVVRQHIQKKDGRLRSEPDTP